jgi:hypothetical protein
MTYMQELEAHLDRFLSGLPEKAIVIAEIKKIALESYRNGQKAGAPKAVPPARRQAARSTGRR